MSNYQNPHAQMPYPHAYGQPPQMGGHYQPAPQGAYVRPGAPQMQRPGYPQQQPYQVQPPQGGYGYPQPHQAPQSSVQVVNTPNGPMYLDVRTNQILGPVQQQPQQQYHQPLYGQAPTRSTAMVHANQAVANPYIGNSRYGSPDPGYQTQPESGQDNRYGQIQQLTQPERIPVMNQPIHAAVQTTPPPSAAPAASVQKDLPGVKSFGYRKQPLSDKDVRIESGTVLGSSLCHVANALVKIAHQKKSDKLVWVQPGLVLRSFYDTSVKDHEVDLFQSSAEGAFKVFRQKLSQTENRNNVAYYRAYDNWMTGRVNDYFECSSTDGMCIDSFADDFGELLKLLETSDTERAKGLLQYLSDVLAQATDDITAARAAQSPKEEEGAEKEEASEVVQENAVVPERVILVYVKLLSSEIGDDASAEGNRVANRIMTNLEEYVDDKMFYLVTLDRRIYRVLYLPNEGVDIRYIEG